MLFYNLIFLFNFIFMTQKDVALYYYVKVYLKKLIKKYLNKQKNI
jgi:hypothetical protein